jgi:hypothetical protein
MCLLEEDEMTPLKMIKKIRKIELLRLERDLADIISYCDNPDIERFVEIMIYDGDDRRTQYLTSSLHRLCWQISDYYEFSFNEFSCSMAEHISSFIGNYFYDDSYFVVEFDGKEWNARTDNMNGKQDVVALLTAAEANADGYMEKERRWEERKLKMRELQ